MEESKNFPGNVEGWGKRTGGFADDKLECPACGKDFATKQGLFTHKKTVHDGVRHRCDLCEKSYTQASSLKTHRLLHTDKKPWSCWCGKSYAEKSTLATHQNVKHNNSGQRFPCSICGKEFGTNGNRKNHEKGVHGKAHQCNQCNEAFKAGSDLRSHILGLHADTELTRKLVQEWDRTLGFDSESIPNEDEIDDKHDNTQSQEAMLQSTDANLNVPKVLKVSNDAEIEDQGIHSPMPEEDVGGLGELSGEDEGGFSSNSFLENSPKKDAKLAESRISDKTEYQRLFVAEQNEHGLFPCDICDLMYAVREELKYHKLVEHEGLRFECTHCKKLFLTETDLGAHRKSCETPLETNFPVKTWEQIVTSPQKKLKGENLLECDVCGFKANRPDRLKEHMLQHDGIRHECKHCNKTFSQWRNLKTHIQKVHEAEPLLCDQCEYTTTRKDSLKLHKESKHQGVEYKCTMCNASYNRKKTLTRHIKSMHTGNGFNCEQCDFTTNLKEHVKSHTLKHHDGNKLFCEFCEASYCSKKDLQNHIANKHFKSEKVQDQRFGCSLCSKSYANKKELKRHFQAVHSNQKFYCELCGVEAPSANLLWRHKRMKHGFKEEKGNFNCDQCDFIANYENALQSHKLSKHSGLEMSCNFCGHRSDSDANLRMHMRTQHTGLGQDMCEINDM